MHHNDQTALTAADVRRLVGAESKCRITAQVPRSLHDEFALTCAAMDTTASKLYRDFMRAYSQAHAAEREAYGAIHEDI